MQAAYGTDSMPETAQNLADEMNISRDAQDAFALASQQKAGAAMTSGRFAREILPVAVPAGKGKEVQVTQDEHPRRDHPCRSEPAAADHAGGWVGDGRQCLGCQ